MTLTLLEKTKPERPRNITNLVFETVNVLEKIRAKGIAQKVISHFELDNDYAVWQKTKTELEKIDRRWKRHARIIPIFGDGSVQIDYGGFRLNKPYSASISQSEITEGGKLGYFSVYPIFNGKKVPALEAEHYTKGWLELPEAVNIAKVVLSKDYTTLEKVLTQ